MYFICAKCAGKIHLDSTSEKNKQKETTKAIDLKNAAKLASIANNGKNAAMVVNTPNVAGIATRIVPRIIFSGE